jgi:hypothetical protein
VAHALGACEDAATWFGCIAATLDISTQPFEATDAQLHQDTLRQVSAQLGTESFERAWQAGQLLAPDIAVKQALSQINTYLHE